MRSRSSLVAASVKVTTRISGGVSGPRERGLAAVPQHQAQVQRGDRVGLAGAGAGLDQRGCRAAASAGVAAGRARGSCGAPSRALRGVAHASPRGAAAPRPSARTRRRPRARRSRERRAPGRRFAHLGRLPSAVAVLVAVARGFARPRLALGRASPCASSQAQAAAHARTAAAGAGPAARPAAAPSTGAARPAHGERRAASRCRPC